MGSLEFDKLHLQRKGEEGETKAVVVEFERDQLWFGLDFQEDFLSQVERILCGDDDAVYYYDSLSGVTNWELSKQGLSLVLMEDEIDWLVPFQLPRSGLERLFTVPIVDEIESIKKKWTVELRQLALESLRAGSPLGSAVMNYEASGSYRAFDALEDAWHFESERDRIMERFGLTEKEVWGYEEDLEEEVWRDEECPPP